MLLYVVHFTRFGRARAHFSPDSCGTNRAGQQVRMRTRL
jgi:hypothetical protein